MDTGGSWQLQTVTQGRNAHSQWVTAYKLQYSEDGVNFYYYKVPGQSSPKVNVEAVT